MTHSAVPTIGVDALTSDSVILDVRENDEWAAGHIADAIHVPMAEIPTRVAQLPADQPLAVICRSGARSARVTAYLAQAGLDARNVAGGMQMWEAAGRPMVSDTGDSPTVI